MPTPTDLPPSIMSHVSAGTNDYPRAKAFYDAVLGTLDITVVMEHAGAAVAYGRAFPSFGWGCRTTAARRWWAMGRTSVFWPRRASR